jgi:hypothetical protein
MTGQLLQRNLQPVTCNLSPDAAIFIHIGAGLPAVSLL